MNQDIKKIYNSFDGKLVGRHVMKIHVCAALLKMPPEIINYVTKNCWFFASMEDAYGYTFTGNDLKDMHLIFLSDELLFQDKKQIQYTIIHEIGHVILKHRNSVLERQSKEEIRKQENEADNFAEKYL